MCAMSPVIPQPFLELSGNVALQMENSQLAQGKRVWMGARKPTTELKAYETSTANPLWLGNPVAKSDSRATVNSRLPFSKTWFAHVRTDKSDTQCSTKYPQFIGEVALNDAVGSVWVQSRIVGHAQCSKSIFSCSWLLENWQTHQTVCAFPKIFF
jgi:hypothetical protein